jgi:hypothetical protein
VSNVERKEIKAAIQRVKEEISRQSEQQTAAERIAAFVVMIPGSTRNGIARLRD